MKCLKSRFFGRAARFVTGFSHRVEVGVSGSGPNSVFEISRAKFFRIDPISFRQFLNLVWNRLANLRWSRTVGSGPGIPGRSVFAGQLAMSSVRCATRSMFRFPFGHVLLADANIRCDVSSVVSSENAMSVGIESA